MASNVIKRGKVYHFKMKVGDKLVRQSLKTTNKEIAVMRAKLLAKDIVQGKWNRVYELGGVKKDRVATIGEALKTFHEASQGRVSLSTAKSYAASLRRIVSLGLGTDKPDDEPVSVISRKLIRDFQKAMMTSYGKDKTSQFRCAVTTNSMIALAKAVFSKRLLRSGAYDSINLGKRPETIGALAETEMLATLRYDTYTPPDSGLVQRVWEEGLKNLRYQDPQAFALFWLVGMSGLRRGEALAARWSWISNEEVRVMMGHGWVSKSKRERSIPVPPEMAAMLKAVANENKWPTGPDDFVLGRTRVAKLSRAGEIGTVTSMKASCVSSRLNRWMASLGWNRRQKAHELRKLFATALCAASDAYTAQLALGHSDIQTTMRYAARPKLKAINAAEVWGKVATAPQIPAS